MDLAESVYKQYLYMYTCIQIAITIWKCAYIRSVSKQLLNGIAI